MTEQWLIQDIEKLMQHRNRVVLLDPTGQCNFVLKILKDQHIAVIETDQSITERWKQEKEELMLRYEAETTYKDKPLVFYVSRSQDKLSFLFDYCFTHGCLDLSHPQDWLKKKIFTSTALQVQLDNPMLLTAAKLGVGKDIAWWKKIVQNLEEVINLDNELLPFLHDPDGYLNSKDADIRRLFEEKIHELLGQQYISKPPKTLANEVAKQLFDGLSNNEISQNLFAVYLKWADSAVFRPSLEKYISEYSLNGTTNPWKAHPEHCFCKLDLIALKQIAENIRNKSFVSEKLLKLEKRIFSSRVQSFVPAWWKDVWTVFNTDMQPLTSCKNFNSLIGYYTSTFSKTDRAIRNLFEVFLNDPSVMRPLQEYYEDLNYQLLQKWFELIEGYRPDQQGYLPSLLSTAKTKTAVIVGDGVRFEMADFIASELEKNFKVDRQIMLAEIPSETENNMSALYVGNKKIIPVHKDREAGLVQATGKNIVFKPLEQINYGVDADYLVLTYKDIDSAGEKMQQAAIKLFSEFESLLIEKITLLLNMGYQEVQLITDHGFTLTGILDEADKIEPVGAGKIEVHERFIRTVEKQNNNEWLGFEIPYSDYKYVYVAKSQRPFKSKGVYGFSHGGFTPQEIIIPKFSFSKSSTPVSQLEVIISNKTDLLEASGELFVIRIEAPQATADLFGNNRKLQIKLYAGNKEYQSSDMFSIEINSVVDKEFSFSGNTEIQAVLLDASTREQLDSTIVKKSNLRDLGGLI
ncbi:hypothetical protein DSECCO2_508710 [anaerobic digester metagenome]